MRVCAHPCCAYALVVADGGISSSGASSKRLPLALGSGAGTASRTCFCASMSARRRSFKTYLMRAMDLRT